MVLAKNMWISMETTYLMDFNGNNGLFVCVCVFALRFTMAATCWHGASSCSCQLYLKTISCWYYQIKYSIVPRGGKISNLRWIVVIQSLKQKHTWKTELGLTWTCCGICYLIHNLYYGKNGSFMAIQHGMKGYEKGNYFTRRIVWSDMGVSEKDLLAVKNRKFN